ncbi:MAG TPA: hypothetical protein VLG10_12825 [Methylomirabilota bacterium]|nr:hypothetical protein [Methylomirabilota bacterium]
MIRVRITRSTAPGHWSLLLAAVDLGVHLVRIRLVECHQAGIATQTQDLLAQIFRRAVADDPEALAGRDLGGLGGQQHPEQGLAIVLLGLTPGRQARRQQDRGHETHAPHSAVERLWADALALHAKK